MWRDAPLGAAERFPPPPIESERTPVEFSIAPGSCSRCGIHPALDKGAEPSIHRADVVYAPIRGRSDAGASEIDRSAKLAASDIGRLARESEREGGQIEAM